jgi:hypothetical protein
LLLKESSPEVKFDVFERLNTGGLNLNAMEIRNAVYRGAFTDLLHECSSDETFRKLWGIPGNKKAREGNVTYSRMRDLELVLRFFALSAAQDRGSKRAAFKTYLGSFMSSRNEEYAKDKALAEVDREKFKRSVFNCFTLLGESAFVISAAARSAPLGDALMYALSTLTREDARDKKTADKVRAAVERLKSEAKFKATMDQGTNGRAKIEQRLASARTAVEQAVRAPKGAP